MAKKVIQSAIPTSNIITDEKDLGVFIKHKRTTLGYTLEQTAQLCNISYRTLSKLENGFEGTRMSTALYVARMLGLKLEIVS
jgi:transcriptional regulator with XRE-family HTH domain